MKRLHAAVMAGFALSVAGGLLVGGLVFAPGADAAPEACTKLASTRLPNAHIDAAQRIPAGKFSFDVKRPGTSPQTLESLPAFCRIAATLTPSPNSDIKIEVWMPENWNGKFQAVGNGQWAGSISYGAMARALRSGYATASTDTGHAAPMTEGSWALGKPELVIDYSWRSEHEMTLKAKALVKAFYGEEPKRSYWNGCSTGGRQGLKEATLYPNDFDGLVIGAPANLRAYRNAWQLQVSQKIDRNPAGAVSLEKMRLVHGAVLKSCDALDGVTDGLIENPRACQFDPASLLCKGTETGSCLTQPQVDVVRAFTTPGKLANGEVYQPGLKWGSELAPYGSRVPGWAAWMDTSQPPPPADNYTYLVYQDPKWDWRTFNVDKALPQAIKANEIETAHEKDLATFLKRGKIIFFQGWGDPSVSPEAIVHYYEQVAKMSPEASRLFMVPGMGHCSGGEGATDGFDMVAALDAWVERGQKPQRVTAVKAVAGQVLRTRPLCSYPQVAHYTGSGSTDDAANFMCTAAGSSSKERR
jgi:feruloyl esterase